MHLLFLHMKNTEPETSTLDPKEEKKETNEEVSGLAFSLKPVTEKPKRKYRKGSKYDPILDQFMTQRRKMVTITVTGKDANYIRTQLNKRIEARDLDKKVKVSVVNNIAYLEKI